MTSALWRESSSYSDADGVEVASWRKSSHSGNDNSTECVEVATWRKASYSGGNGGACVEAGVAARGQVLIRDTTNRDGAALTVDAAAWRQFTASLR